MTRVRVGEAVLLIADDPLARIDAPHFAASAGHALVRLEEADGVLHIVVVRGGLPPG